MNSVCKITERHLLSPQNGMSSVIFIKCEAQSYSSMKSWFFEIPLWMHKWALWLISGIMPTTPTKDLSVSSGSITERTTSRNFAPITLKMTSCARQMRIRWSLWTFIEELIRSQPSPLLSPSSFPLQMSLACSCSLSPLTIILANL